MAYAPSSSTASAVPRTNAAYKSPTPSSGAPQGTFLPGTKVQVGSHRVIIEKYLSEGGFAHVYVARIPRDNHKHELGVLKRVAVPDRENLASMRTEVETMKKLQGHKHVVTYMDSHASQLKGGGYEVFLLMEYCSGGGLIDFMNTRLQHRLTEPEILKIFGDVAEGVAAMHYLKPPLLHRDLKVENVLISKSASSGAPTYKICDFGSAAPPRPAAKTTDEGRLIEEDVQKHTTMQYRSPEMIDVWRKQPIDEKADIWALGVLLYKLCYYTTPFEDVGQMAILNASFKYPSHPSFSPRLKKFIGNMLKEDPKQRLNIYQAIEEVCSMRGTEVPIKDIYAQRTHSQARRNESLPSPDPPMSIGLQKQATPMQAQALPDITPMRRGRPTAPVQQGPLAANKPSPSPARGDPFAALDSKNYDVRAGAVDELSKRFPSLNEFSITHDKGSDFQFPRSPPKSANVPAASEKSNLNVRVTNALADEVFKQTKPTAEIPKSQTAAQLEQRNISPSRTVSVKAKVQEMSKAAPVISQPPSTNPSITYTSTATGSSPPLSTKRAPEVSSRPIWRVPDHNRSSSQPRASETAQAAAASLQPTLPPSQRPALLDLHRSKSQTATMNTSTSSRPSLEGGRPSQTDLDIPGDTSLTRTKSATQFSRQRPSSAYVTSNIDYLRDQEQTRKWTGMPDRSRRQSKDLSRGRDMELIDTNISDDMDYLRQNEEAERKSHHHIHKPSVHRKRGSHSITGAAKHVGGKFGGAFKRSERQSSSESSPVRPSSSRFDRDDDARLISPVDGLEAPSIVRSDADSAIDETEDLPPDMRREMERRRLSQEEKRVANAAAEYRARVAADGTGGAFAVPSKASTIQKRVQSLLDEVGQNPAPSKTAEGYGRYTEPLEGGLTTTSGRVQKAAPPPLAKKPVTASETPDIPYQKTRQQRPDTLSQALPIPPNSAPPTQTLPPQPRIVSRPSVPPKSQALRTGGAGSKQQWPPAQQQPEPPAPSAPPSAKPSNALAALLAKDLEGVPDYPPHGSNVLAEGSADQNGSSAPVVDRQYGDADVEEDFSKRYPSLSGIEMVETEIGGVRRVLKVRDV